LERRERDRYRIWFAVDVRTPDGRGGDAVTYDASDKGLMLLAPFSIPLGESVRVTMQLAPGEGDARVVSGTVVRAGKNQDDPEGLWPFRLAVEFDEETPDIEAHLVILSARHPLRGRAAKP
jgi:hypothetical protein